MLPRGNAQMAQWLMAAKVGVTPNYRSQTLLYLWFFKPKMPYPTPPKKRIPPEKLKRYSLHPNFTLLGLERSRCQGCLAKGTPDKQSLAGKVVTKIPKQKKKTRRCRHHLLLYPRLLLIHPPEGLQMLHPKLLSG